MSQKKKPHAKEAPKARLLLLFVMIVLFVATPWLLSDLPKAACVMMGIFCADLFYFLFVVLKAQRNLSVRLRGIGEEERQAHAGAEQTARRIAREGIVLLQNSEALLPLVKGSRLNLIGLRCVQMNYNGGGSAATDENKCTTLEAALRQTGFELNTELLNISYNYLKNGTFSADDPGKNHRVKQGSGQKGGAEFVPKPGSPVREELPVEALNEPTLFADGRTALERARDFSENALIVLSRGGGEGYDLDAEDLRLIESERKLLDTVCAHFDRVILILNTANTLEMGWLRDYPAIKAVLWIGFPGATGNLALGDILNGDAVPCGHLPDTWAADNISAPAAHNFCETDEEGRWKKESFHYRNAPKKAGYFVKYSEGIYVGYRYYETRAALDPDFDYGSAVVWPFGYGLSYTQFHQTIEELRETADYLHLRVRTENTGSFTGKALVQCYVTPPYSGRIERSIAALCAYVKTEELAPGSAAETVLEIRKRDLAGFDPAAGCWLLEAGGYRFSLRSDAHTPICGIDWRLEQEISYSGSKELFADADTVTLRRGDFTNPAHPAFSGPGEEDFAADADTLAALEFHVPTDAELGLKVSPPTARPAGIKLADLCGVPKEDDRWDTFVQQLTIPELCNLCGNGAWQTVAVPRLGVPRTIAPDGSTSIGATKFSALVMGTGKAGITWPCPAILAAAFDPGLADAMGDAVGAEGQAMHYTGWYAPAMNCHRTAFNSRNFEYYSEDPLLAGRTAAHVVSAVQNHGLICYIKHFALNERETNARNQLFTWCNEQAMREIYLRPFEIAVREGGALGVMSCFNYIGHTWAGGSRALLTDLLRGEWGFQGIVITDACLYPHMDVTQMLYAGGDLSLDSLGGFTGGNIKRRSLLAAAQDPAHRHGMTIWLQSAAKDILYAVAQTRIPRQFYPR